jgi:hypothetical protein
MPGLRRQDRSHPQQQRKADGFKAILKIIKRKVGSKMKKIIDAHNRAHRAAEGKLQALTNFVMPLKMFASAIFTGIIILYMVSGVAYAYITGNAFEYAIPFVFVLQGLLLAALISLLWGIFISEAIIKSWRYFQRLIVFSIFLMILLAACIVTFIAIPTEWSWFWLIINGAIGLGLIKFSVISEIRFKRTGKRYTEILKNFQSGI